MQVVDISYCIFTRNLTAFNFEHPSRTHLYSTESKGSCNCEKIEFIPHAHCTHTETIHHITNSFTSKSSQIIQEIPFQQKCLLIEYETLKNAENSDITALIVKFGLSLPYSDSPHHFTESDFYAILEKFPQANHLLCDLPSLDKKDDPQLTCHRQFFDKHPRGTITEMCDLTNVKAGKYTLFLAPLIIHDSDAHPARPFLLLN